jgi:hypothetical protein
MRFLHAFAVAVLTTVALASAAFAAPPADRIGTVLRELGVSARTIEWATTQYDDFVDNGYPPEASDAFDEAYFENLQRHLRAKGRADLDAKSRNDLFDIFAATGFATVAADEIFDLAPEEQTHRWVRRLESEPRDATAFDTAAWLEVRRKYTAFHAHHYDAAADPLSALGNLELHDDPEALARAFSQRLAELYGNGRGADDPLMQDLGRVQAFLAGQVSRDDPTPRAALALRDISAELARQPDRDLFDVVNERNAEAGFRRTIAVPFGILRAPSFFRMIGGGVMPYDVGAGRHHGAETHGLQMEAWQTHYEMNRSTFNRMPIETVRLMSEFELEGMRSNFTFAGENANLWGHVFDFQPLSGPQAVEGSAEKLGFSYPENVRPALSRAKERHPELNGVRERVETVFDERSNKGEELVDTLDQRRADEEVGQYEQDYEQANLGKVIFPDDRYTANFSDLLSKSGFSPSTFSGTQEQVNILTIAGAALPLRDEGEAYQEDLAALRETDRNARFFEVFDAAPEPPAPDTVDADEQPRAAPEPELSESIGGVRDGEGNADHSPDQRMDEWIAALQDAPATPDAPPGAPVRQSSRNDADDDRRRPLPVALAAEVPPSLPTDEVYLPIAAGQDDDGAWTVLEAEREEYTDDNSDSTPDGSDRKADDRTDLDSWERSAEGK